MKVRALIWLGACGMSVAMAAGAIRVGALSAPQACVHYAAALLAVTVGLIAWARRPDSRIGALLVAGSLIYLLGELGTVFPASALAVTVAYATFRLGAAVFAQTFLTYPTGRFASRVERGFVAAVYATGIVYGLAYLLFYDPRAPHDPGIWECPRCALPLTHVASLDLTGVTDLLDAVFLVLTVGFIVLLARKLVRAAPGPRRVVVPLAVAAFIGAGQFAVQLGLWLAGSSASFWTSNAAFWVETVAVLAIPLALAVGVLWGRSARAAVADLVVALAHTPPGAVRDALARALGDPSLELALWRPDRRSYVDSAGRPFELPPPSSGRGVCVLGGADAPIAALVHDPALRERQALLDAVAAAGRLALENERLQAELRAQLGELRESRARIVEASDAERRRLERNLHDGAQQRLLAVGLALQIARQQLGPDVNGAADVLGEADAELRCALDELRELARGLHPAILTDHGLGAAIQAVADRSVVPVVIAELPEGRLPGSAEAAVYFLVCEGLANVTKYAHASRVTIAVARCDGLLTVELADNGAGGADPCAGSGLRGLVDRFQALDGQLLIDSPVGAGTRLHAELPCE
jgi:signal transduction histidine kinase